MEPTKGSIITSPNMMERFRVIFTKMVNESVQWYWGNTPGVAPLEFFGGGKAIVSNDDPAGVIQDGNLTSDPNGGTFVGEEDITEEEGPFYTNPSYRVKYTDYDTENGEYIWGANVMGKGGMSLDAGEWRYYRGAFKEELVERNGGWWDRQINSRNFAIGRRRTVTKQVTKPVPGVPRGTLRITGDIIEADDVAGTMGAYLSLFSRARKMTYIEEFGETNMQMTQAMAESGDWPITWRRDKNETAIAHWPTPGISNAEGIAKATEFLNNDTSTGIVQGDIITADGLNTALDKLIAEWERIRDTEAEPKLFQFCHSSCHFSCHSSSSRR